MVAQNPNTQDTHAQVGLWRAVPLILFPHTPHYPSPTIQYHEHPIPSVSTPRLPPVHAPLVRTGTCHKLRARAAEDQATKYKESLAVLPTFYPICCRCKLQGMPLHTCIAPVKPPLDPPQQAPGPRVPR